MANVKGLDDGPLEAEVTTPSSQISEIDTKDRCSSSDADTLEALVSEVENCKNRGNVEFYKGRALAKHTAGKNLLRDACILYAEGLQALAKADARLLAGRQPDEQHGQHDLQQQQQQQEQQQPEKDQEVRVSDADSFGTTDEGNNSVKATPAPASTSKEITDEEDPATRRTLPPSQLQLMAALSRRADAVRPSLYLNLAACNLLLQEWDPAIACCTRVLEDFCAEVETDAEEVGAGERAADGISATATTEETLQAGEQHQEQAREGLGGEAPRNSRGRVAGDGIAGGGVETAEERAAERSRRRETAAKCLYRRAAARKGGGDLSAAREDLVGALRLRPRDAAIGRELKNVEKKLADEEARESLRRKTEEGRRRRQQQQQQQQQQSSPSSGDRAADATATTAAIPSAAQRADNAAIAGGGAGARTALDTGVGNSGKKKTAGSAGDSLDEDAGGHAGQAGGGRSSQGQQEATRSEGDEKGEKSGAEEGSNGRSGEPPSEDDDVFPTRNGGECRNGLYAWNQSIREVQVCVEVPVWARARDVRVDIRRRRVSVAVVGGRTHGNSGNGGNGVRRVEQGATSGGNGAGSGSSGSGGGSSSGGQHETAALMKVLLEGGLSRPVQVDECLWTMERAGRVLLYLQKELPVDCEPGFEWWASVLEGDPKVDVLTCDAGSDASKYPEHAKRRGARALWEHQNKSPEEKLKEEQMRNARRQMEEEAEERQRDLKNAMKDPKKAELYRKLRETMPDTSICIK